MRRVSFRDGASSGGRLVALNDKMQYIGGHNPVNSDVMEKCLSFCQEEACRNGSSILFLSPLVLENHWIENLKRKNWQMMGRQNLTIASARYLFIPINTMNNTHWEAVIVDLHSREMFVFDSLIPETYGIEYWLYPKPDSYNKGYDNFNSILAHSLADDPDIEPFIDDDDRKSYLSKIVSWYNSYSEFMISMYNSNVILLCQSKKTAFRAHLRRYVQVQTLNNCGIYVMALAYHLSQADNFNIPDHWYHPDYTAGIARKEIDQCRLWMTKQFVYGWSHGSMIRIRNTMPRLEAAMQRLCYKLCNCICQERVKRYVVKPLAVGRDGESTEFTRIFQVAFDVINPLKRTVINESMEKVIRLISADDIESETDIRDCDVCILLSNVKTKQGYEFTVAIKNMELPLAAWRFFDIRIPASHEIRNHFEYRGFI
jgi:hypothetical protein